MKNNMKLRKKIEQILLIQAPIYSGTSGKGIKATKQLLALLSSQEKEIKEKLRKKIEELKEDTLNQDMFGLGFNQALDDVLELLKE